MLETSRHLAIAAGIWTLLVICIGRFFVKGYAVRRRFHNLPGPPHSYLWGHLKVMGEIMQDLPPRVHPAVVPMRLAEKYNLKTSYMYLDLWPAADEMLAVFDKDLVQQITIDHQLPKHAGMAEFMTHLSGPGDLVSSNGPYWKKWRSIMNPGFAAGHLMTLVPAIVEHSVIFTEKLSEHASKREVFRLEEDATRLTVDIIGNVALDLQLDTQRGENEMITAFREQVHLVPNEGAMEPFKMWYPTGIYRRWRNTRIMNNYIGRVLDERFVKLTPEANGVPAGQKKERKRAVIDLALESYRAQKAEEGGKAVGKDSNGIDKEFRKAAITQMRTFLFAGHDTTSSTICYALYALQKHPECLAQIRKEHDDILGSVESTPQVIKDDPHILNRLEYTTAVIRETLRMWTPASGTRLGDSEHVVRDPKTGEPLLLDGLLIWIVSISHHRNPKTWGETAHTFDPLRFLPDNAAKLPENAWRPFEKGPRNCIGQDLAMLEARIILALVVRRFEFTLAYDSLDELKDDGSFYAKDASFRKGRQDWNGEEAYPILLGTAKPREGMPMRVKQVL